MKFCMYMQYEYIYKLCKKYRFYVGNYKILKKKKNYKFEGMRHRQI
jgi:hypothetical protein